MHIMSDKKISIVMPVYNAGIYLKDAIQDILGQSYADFELICVNDGSTDRSLEVLEYFSGIDNRISIINQENKGAGAARNTGLEHAKGRYILFLDADDRFELCFLEEMLGEAVRTNAQIVVCDAYQFDNETGELGDIEGEGWILKRSFSPEKDVFSALDYPDKTLGFTSLLAWNKLYDLQYVRSTGACFQEIPYNNDALFVATTLALADRIRIISKRLIYYRINNTNSISWYENKKLNPHYWFEMVYGIRDMLIANGRFEELKHSLALFVTNYLWGSIWYVTEDNYETFVRYLDGGFAARLCLADLSEEDVGDKTLYDDIKSLCDGGAMGLFARTIHRFAKVCNSQREHIDYLRKSNGTMGKRFLDAVNVHEGSSVVIYGAGFRGGEIVKKNIDICKYKIVAWVDAKADSISAERPIKVEQPEVLAHKSFDYVIIAVDKLEVMKEIKLSLICLGVKEEKIIWW